MPLVTGPQHPVQAAGSERRVRNRHTLRLRLGLLANLSGAFLSEVSVRDLSAGGARLRLLRPVEWHGDLLFVDPAGERYCRATLIWRRQREIGILFGEWKVATRHGASPVAALLRTGYALEG